MTEEATPPAEQPVETAQPSAEVATEEAGSKFVPIEDKEVKDRFNKVYGQFKFQQRVNDELVTVVKDLKSKLEKIESKGAEKEASDQKQTVKYALAKAHENSDSRAVAELTAKLVELEKPAPAPKPEPVNTDDMSPQDKENFTRWLTELGEDGNLKRPWALQHHPKYNDAIEVTNVILADPSISMNGLNAVLNALDQRMTPKKAAPAPTTAAVLSGGAKRPMSKSLSPEEQYVAKKMGLSPEDYLKSKNS